MAGVALADTLCMATREIPRQEWVRFFDSFSQVHAGWFVTVEVLGPSVGDQIEASETRLFGIGADVRDDKSEIEITVGVTPEAHLRHIVSEASRVYLKTDEEGADEVLEIEAVDATTLILFQKPRRPEELDAVAVG